MNAHQKQTNKDYMTVGGHLEIFRQMFFRILGIICIIFIVIYCFKDMLWNILLAPTHSNFILYQVLQHYAEKLSLDSQVDTFHVNMMSTDLASQFMLHISTSLYTAIIFSSPYILYELYRFISPALYKSERKIALTMLGAIYILFLIGLIVNYIIIMPLSFRFLGTYQVSPDVKIQITLDSYISTFLSLSLVMGIVFQMPIISYFLARCGLIQDKILKKYRRHSIVLIVLLSAIITPSADIFSCLIVSLPLYALYEISIIIISRTEQR